MALGELQPGPPAGKLDGPWLAALDGWCSRYEGSHWILAARWSYVSAQPVSLGGSSQILLWELSWWSLEGMRGRALIDRPAR